MNNCINLQRMNLLVTKRCNLRCRMCNYRLTSFFLNDISFEQIKNLLYDAKNMGLQQLEISGGEPMLKEEIYDIIRYASSLGVKVMLMTNAVLIGEDEAKKLVEAGLNGIVISLEGFEELNDRIRGKGNYKKAINAIKFLQKWKDRIEFIKVGVTISRYNYSSLYDFTKYLFEELEIDAISYNPFNKDMLLNKTFEIRRSEFVMDDTCIQGLKDQLGKIIDYSHTQVGEFQPEEFILKIPDYFKGESMRPIHGCTSPENGCCIDSAGSVYACWGDPVKMGNINENTLEEILLSPKYKEFCMKAKSGNCKGCLSACYADVHIQ